MANIPIEAQVSTDQLLHAAQQLPADEFAAFVEQLLQFRAHNTHRSQTADTNQQHERLTTLAAQVRATKQRVLGLNAGAVVVADDFDAPLSDGFWLGAE